MNKILDKTNLEEEKYILGSKFQRFSSWSAGSLSESGEAEHYGGRAWRKRQRAGRMAARKREEGGEGRRRGRETPFQGIPPQPLVTHLLQPHSTCLCYHPVSPFKYRGADYATAIITHHFTSEYSCINMGAFEGHLISKSNSLLSRRLHWVGGHRA